MGSFLRKGKREVKKKQAKDSENVIAQFQKTLVVMNEVYQKIMTDESVTEENLDVKLTTAMGRYKLSDRQLDILVKDIMTNKGFIAPDEQQQPVPQEEAIAYTK